MLQIPEETGRRFEAAMAAAEVVVQERWYYRKWLRYYLDFCAKYGRPAAEETSLGPFLEKLVRPTCTGRASSRPIPAASRPTSL